MKHNVYSIRDVNVGFNTPMVDISDATATRNFSYAINNPNSGVLGFSAGDYDLYRIGEFDDETGALVSLPVPELVVHGSSVKGADVK